MNNMFYYSMEEDARAAYEIAKIHREPYLVEQMNICARDIQRKNALGLSARVDRSWFRRYWMALRIIRMPIVQFS